MGKGVRFGLGSTFVLAASFGLACGAPVAAGSAESGDEEACSQADCTSTLVISLEHSYPLTEGGYRVEMDTPLHQIRCSVPTDPAGTDSCFGFRFADIEWNSGAITLTLTEPFFDTDLNPEALPFEAVTVRVLKDGMTIADTELAVDGGERIEPNGPECGPLCWQAVGAAAL